MICNKKSKFYYLGKDFSESSSTETDTEEGDNNSIKNMEEDEIVDSFETSEGSSNEETKRQYNLEDRKEKILRKKIKMGNNESHDLEEGEIRTDTDASTISEESEGNGEALTKNGYCDNENGENQENSRCNSMEDSFEECQTLDKEIEDGSRMKDPTFIISRMF
jgi:hypothetical protein